MPSRGFWVKPSGNIKGILRQARGTRAYADNVKRRKVAGAKARHKARKRGFFSRLFG